MSIGPVGGLAASLSGTPLAQVKGTELERAELDSSAHERRIRSDELAETAAGIGPPDGEDHESAGRGANGRPSWQVPSDETPESIDNESGTADPSQPNDASGQSGRLLDLEG